MIAFPPRTRLSAAYTYLANSPLVSQIAFKQATTTRMTTTKQYDFLNRLLSVASAPSAASALNFGYLYNTANQRIRSLLPDGSYWLYEYDSLGQVRSGHKFWPDQTPVAGQQFEYAFDDIGNRTQTKAGGDQNGANLRAAGYSANNLNQYTSRDAPGAIDVMGLSFATNTVTVNGQSAYRKGEYFRKELPLNNTNSPLWTNITVAATGQASVSGNELLPQTPEQFYYDADGNLTQDGLWSYTWDGENRLVSMQSLSTVPAAARRKLDFTYDWRSRRTQKVVSTWNGSAYVAQSTNKFVYDGWNLVAILDAQSSILDSLVWGLDLSGSAQGPGGVGGLLWMTVHSGTNAGTYFHGYDGNGNVMALVNAVTGAVAAQYEYGPFGEVIRATGPMAKSNPFRFSTKYQHAETDLLYYGERYYNPCTGRWLSRDPLTDEEGVLSGEEFGGLNLCEFAGNNPLGQLDILGLALYVIDGTMTDAAYHSNPRQLYETTLERPRFYRRGTTDGPGGSDCLQIAFDIYYTIQEDYCSSMGTTNEFTINLTGFSRGAMIAARVASMISDLGFWCRGDCAVRHYRPRVNWVGLFDAVSMMHDSGWPREVPRNVAHFDHAIKTKHMALLPTWHFEGSNEHAFNNYDGTLTSHRHIGRSGNKNGAYLWIRSQAVAAGVRF